MDEELQDLNRRWRSAQEYAFRLGKFGELQNFADAYVDVQLEYLNSGRVDSGKAGRVRSLVDQDQGADPLRYPFFDSDFQLVERFRQDSFWDEVVDSVVSIAFSGSDYGLPISSVTSSNHYFVRAENCDHKLHGRGINFESGDLPQADLEDETVLIVDDDMMSGKTLRRVYDEVSELEPRNILVALKNIAFGADVPDGFEDENVVIGIKDDGYDADIEESPDGFLYEQEDGYGIK